MNENQNSKEVVPKSFDDLVLEIHELGICGECGGCVSFCSAADLGAIKMSEDGPPQYIDKDNCLHCGICYLICPEIHELNKELNERYKFKLPIGNWLKIVTGKATNLEIQKAGTDGGVVTSILIAMLENNLIDGALVSKRINPFQREPFLATTKEELIEAAGTKFDLKGHISGLGQYNTFVPTISRLRYVLDRDLMNIAVVGVPCQIHSIRKMQELSILPAHIIKYTLGLFCYENFKFDETARKKMEERFDFFFNDIEKMNIKDYLIIYLKGKDQPLYIELSELHDIMRHACSVCENFSNFYSDISFGGLGSKDGFTTSIIRTDLGEKIYKLAIDKGYIEEPPELNTSVEKSKMLAKIISFSRMKTKRAEDALKHLPL